MIFLLPFILIPILGALIVYSGAFGINELCDFVGKIKNKED